MTDEKSYVVMDKQGELLVAIPHYGSEDPDAILLQVENWMGFNRYWIVSSLEIFEKEYEVLSEL